jgi:hypothetical protein
MNLAMTGEAPRKISRKRKGLCRMEKYFQVPEDGFYSQYRADLAPGAELLVDAITEYFSGEVEACQKFLRI